MNLFDIMVKAYTAFAPAIMVPLLAGVLFRGLNSRGAYTGIIAGFVSGTFLLVLNIILVGLYQEQFVTNPRLNYWLNQGWTSTSIILNFGITILGLWLGSSYGKISKEESMRIDQFFKQLETPYETEISVKIKSPFPVIGIIVAVMGIGMTAAAFAVNVLYDKPGWFKLNMLAAVILLVVGVSIWFVSRERGSRDKVN